MLFRLMDNMALVACCIGRAPTIALQHRYEKLIGRYEALWSDVHSESLIGEGDVKKRYPLYASV